VLTDINERKNAYEELRQSEKRFRSYFHLSLIGMAITSLEKGWLEVNERLCEIFGYPREELICLTWVDITHPDDINRDVAEFERVLRRESEGYSLEKRFIRKDGAVIHAAISVHCVHQDNGQIDYFVALVQDITERKLAEEKLRLNDQAFNAISQAVIIVDVEGCITWVNNAFTVITGYNQAEVIGQNCRFLQGPLTDPQTVDTMRLALRNVAKFNGEILNYRKDGTPIWNDLSISPVFNEQGQLAQFLGVIRDISVRKQYETGRDEALDRLQKIARRIPGLVYQFRLRPDGSSCLPFASETLHEIYRINPEDVRFDAAQIFALVHPEDLDCFMASIQQSAQNLSPWHQEFRVRFDDGTVRWLLGNSLPEREMDGSTLWHGYVSDITERIQNQQKLRDLSTHLEVVREEERSRISREIHDQLGSVLTALKIDLSWLRKHLPTKLSACQQKASLMDSQLNDAIQTIKEIATDLRPSILDHLGLLAAIEWQLEKFQEQTGVKSVLLDCKTDITIDEKTSTMIFRIVQEALTNIARHAKATEVIFNIAIVDNQLLVTITDNGCGMSPAEMQMPGKYGIVGMHERTRHVNGTINIKSRPGAGTQIELRLPQPSWTVKND
jgi:PAS domain S-box-containing protein